MKQTVIITGSSRGIGEAIAMAYAEAGHNVVINYAYSEEKANKIVENIKAFGGNAIAVKADVSNYQEAEFLVKQTLEHFNSVDVLINNSGVAKDQLLLRMKEDDFDQVIDINLKGTWNMCKHAAPIMLKQRKGYIINISSVVSLIGNPGQSNYVASKSGVNGLTKSLAKELGGRNINVNAIAPGFIETDMTHKLNDEIKAYYLNQIPLKRFGQVNDIAQLCLFLTSHKADYITGQIISVNGGMI